MSKTKRNPKHLSKSGKKFMAKFTGPLQIPDLEQVIANAVEQFARSLGLEYELWYHDEPLWLILKRGNKITLSLQIGAYVPTRQRGPTETRLYFIPNAYFFDEEKLEAFTVPEDIVIKNLHSVLLQDIISKKGSEVLDAMLKDAWNDVQNLKDSNLKKSTGKIPAMPTKS